MDRELTPLDFSARHKLAFDIQGNELTPSARYDFKFKDYAPWIFRDLRKIFHIDAADYLVSLTGKYILSELGSPGKSGSFFYFSRDYRFIIKTLHHAEHKFLRRILPEYHKHTKLYPNTLISQFYGLHRVKTSFGKKIHFVVMNNLFPPHMDIHSTYDVKGSTVGRVTTEDDKKGNPRGTLKDLNWLNSKQYLKFPPDKKKAFLEQVQKDVELLAKLKIMDYSLLLGIHNMREAALPSPVVPSSTPERPPTEVSQNVPGPLTRTPSVSGQNYRHRDLRRMVTPRDGTVTLAQIAAAQTSPTTLPVSGISHGATAQHSVSIDHALNQANSTPLAAILSGAPAMQQSVGMQHSIFYQFEGGVRSQNANGLPGNIIYFVGIIDLLTNYGPRKRLENLLKGLGRSEEIKKQISAVPPQRYADRFRAFVSSMAKTPEEVEKARLRRTPSAVNLEHAIHELQREHITPATAEPETVLTAVQAQDFTGEVVLPVLEEASDDSTDGIEERVNLSTTNPDHRRRSFTNKERLQEAAEIQEARRASLDEIQGTSSGLLAKRESFSSEIVPEEVEPDGHDSGLATSLDCLPEESETSRQSSLSRTTKDISASHLNCTNGNSPRDPAKTSGGNQLFQTQIHSALDGGRPVVTESSDAALFATYRVNGADAQFRVEPKPVDTPSKRVINAEEKAARRRGVVEPRRGAGIQTELERRTSTEKTTESASLENEFEDEGYEESPPDIVV